MSTFQLISILFALFMLYIVHIHRRKKSLEKPEVIIWYLLWVGFILLSLFPNTLSGVIEILHFSRVFDLLVVVGMMILTVVVMMTYFGQKASSRRLEEFIRREAIKK